MTDATLPRRWHGRQPGETVEVEARGSHAPYVARRGDELLFVALIPIMHFDAVLEFPMTPENVEVLREDAARSFFLFAYLCAEYGSHPVREPGREQRLPPAELGAVYDLLLHGAEGDVEPFLFTQDRASRGYISHAIFLHTGWDLEEMRAGRWFAAARGTNPA